MLEYSPSPWQQQHTNHGCRDAEASVNCPSAIGTGSEQILPWIRFPLRIISVFNRYAFCIDSGAEGLRTGATLTLLTALKHRCTQGERLRQGYLTFPYPGCFCTFVVDFLPPLSFSNCQNKETISSKRRDPSLLSSRWTKCRMDESRPSWKRAIFGAEFPGDGYYCEEEKDHWQI